MPKRSVERLRSSLDEDSGQCALPGQRGPRRAMTLVAALTRGGSTVAPEDAELLLARMQASAHALRMRASWLLMALSLGSQLVALGVYTAYVIVLNSKEHVLTGYYAAEDRYGWAVTAFTVCEWNAPRAHPKCTRAL